jgi:hypothetical protein
MSMLLDNRLAWCAHVLYTGIEICSRERLPEQVLANMKVAIVPPSLAFADFNLEDAPGARVDDRGVVVRAHMFAGGLGQLPRGTYEWTFDLMANPPLPRDGSVMARLEIVQRDRILAFAEAPNGATELKVRFDADGSDAAIVYRFRTWPTSPVIITDARLHRADTR